jgi:hypothetical protein
VTQLAIIDISGGVMRTLTVAEIEKKLMEMEIINYAKWENHQINWHEYMLELRNITFTRHMLTTNKSL